MNRGVAGALVAVGAVVVVAILSRAGRPNATAEPPDGRPAPGPGADETTEATPSEGEADAESCEVVAVTSDGYALVPDVHAVRLVPPDEAGEAWKAGESARVRRGELALAMSWHAGDFTGARVVRGAADEGPWRFEAMGREGEYTAFVFESREAADAALGVFQSRGVVRHGRDEDGNEMPASAEHFAEARRVYLETEAALELDDE
ncbi:MAG TPA: hypothetical protein VMH61_07100 [Candidatus Acidoferrales bacterium]|nr:hypothetical protein [Candidatus Acidoferrales bacterium]